MERIILDFITGGRKEEQKKEITAIGRCRAKEPNLEDHERVRSCELCGSAVILESGIAGTRYYTPVDSVWLEGLMTTHSSDNFILDRLRRAEKIIVDLRRQLIEKEIEGN